MKELGGADDMKAILSVYKGKSPVRKSPMQFFFLVVMNRLEFFVNDRGGPLRSYAAALVLF
jgi:hypothetical protein